MSSRVSDLRIVLLGKSVSENSRVGNFLLGRAAFDSEAPPDVVERVGGRLKDRHVMVINSPQLLQTNISDHQITQTVRECVYLSDPGPHAFILVLQHNDFTEEDMRRVKHVLDEFSEEAIKRTIVLTTDERTHDAQGAPVKLNEFIQQLTAECGGGHLQLDNDIKRLISGVSQRLEKILRENSEEFLTCDLYDSAEGSSVDEEQSRSVASRRTEDADSDGSRENTDEVRIVLLGKIGVGKSATGNTILGRDAFPAETSQESVTKASQRETSEINGRCVSVIDTPGLFDTELTNEEIQREISNCISMILPGPHVFLLLIPLGRFTKHEEASVKIIQETFGERSLMFTMVLFTRGDDLKDKTIDQCLGKPGSALMKLIEACGNRFHVFNNNQTGDRTQVSDLLEKIDNMVKANGGSFYSCKMFREMEREKQERQMKILMDRLRERDEEMRKLEEEKERMKKMVEEERQNHDKERKRREEELKREIREQEKQQREIRDEMRREREEWEKQKLKMRREKQSDTNILTNCAEADDQKCLRVVLIGRTGNGKSATGNTILGRNEFQSLDMSLDSVTTVCQKAVGEVDGRSVAVVDTPAIFDATLTKEEVVEEIVRFVSLSSPGPHVFVIVLSVERFTKEETGIIDQIKKNFGHKASRFCIVLFTRGDKLQNESIQDYVERSNTAELKKLITDCGNRFLVFNNRENQDRTQVIQLLNMIEEVKNSNEGRYFTNSMFGEAEMSIKRRIEEIMKEKEIQNQKE